MYEIGVPLECDYHASTFLRMMWNSKILAITAVVALGKFKDDLKNEQLINLT